MTITVKNTTQKSFDAYQATLKQQGWEVNSMGGMTSATKGKDTLMMMKYGADYMIGYIVVSEKVILFFSTLIAALKKGVTICKGNFKNSAIFAK